MHLLKRTWEITEDLFNQFFQDGCSYRAASLAYSTLLSLVPLLIVVFYILSFFPVFKGTGEAFQQFLLNNFVAASANVISKKLNEFISNLNALSWPNLISLAGVSILLMYNMVKAFNAIWHVEMKQHFAISFIIYLVILFLSPILFGVLLLLSSYIASLPLISGATMTYFIKQPFLILFPYIIALLTFTFFNWILPSCKVRLLYAFIAGVITTLFFELAKFLFSLYLSFFPTYRLIYGALATIPLFLIWLYVSWTIILFGAIVCYNLSIKFPKK